MDTCMIPRNRAPSDRVSVYLPPALRKAMVDKQWTMRTLIALSHVDLHLIPQRSPPARATATPMADRRVFW